MLLNSLNNEDLERATDGHFQNLVAELYSITISEIFPLWLNLWKWMTTILKIKTNSSFTKLKFLSKYLNDCRSIFRRSNIHRPFYKWSKTWEYDVSLFPTLSLSKLCARKSRKPTHVSKLQVTVFDWVSGTRRVAPTEAIVIYWTLDIATCGFLNP